MDAKLKAKELVDKFYSIHPQVTPGTAEQNESGIILRRYSKAKQCALIAVEEIIAAIKEFHTGAEWQLKESMAWTYWHLVIEEINKL